MGLAWPALEHQGLGLGPPFGADEQVGEDRVGLVGTRFGQAHLEGRQQLDVEVLVARVEEVDLPELDVVLGADPGGGVGPQQRPGGVEAHPVGMEGAGVLRCRIGCGMLGDREELLAGALAQVEEAAQLVAQRVVTPAVDGHAAAAALAGTVGAQGHAVAAVAQQVGGLDGTGPRHHLAQWPGRPVLQRQRRLRRQAGGHVHPGRHLARGALVQQRGHGLDLRVGHAPALGQLVHQHIGQRHDAHALVVGHEGEHWREVGAAAAARR